MISRTTCSAFMTTALLRASDVYAQTTSTCTLNGEEVPCGEMLSAVGWVVWVPFILIFLLLVAATCFWLWMLIDCLKSHRSDKLVWVLVILFGNLFGAILYLFLARNKNEATRV